MENDNKNSYDNQKENSSDKLQENAGNQASHNQELNEGFSGAAFAERDENKMKNASSKNQSSGRK